MWVVMLKGKPEKFFHGYQEKESVEHWITNANKLQHKHFFTLLDNRCDGKVNAIDADENRYPYDEDSFFEVAFRCSKCGHTERKHLTDELLPAINAWLDAGNTL